MVIPGPADRGDPEINLDSNLMEQGLALLEEHISPLDIMKAAMLRRPLSNGKLVDAQQFAAAVALAPYVHPKLNAVMVRDMTDAAPPPPPMLSVADIVAMARKPPPR